MNAVERLLYYVDNVDQEQEPEEGISVSERWPQRGEIEFSDVRVSHRPGLPLALKGVNLNQRRRARRYRRPDWEEFDRGRSVWGDEFRVRDHRYRWCGHVEDPSAKAERWPVECVFRVSPAGRSSRPDDSHPTRPAPLQWHNMK